MKIDEAAAKVVAVLCEKGLTLATAESCTGGGLGYAITAVPGSSGVYLGGVISYANDVKEQVLGVPLDVLKQHGAVSRQTAEAMVQGVRKVMGSDVSVGITGIAGPASDDTNKPVGLVYISVDVFDKLIIKENHFIGSREEIRQQSILEALCMIIENV